MPYSYIQRVFLSLGCLILILLAPARASSQSATTSEGTAYRLDDGVAAYREIHMQYVSGGMPARLVLYTCMDGTAFARKTVMERSGEKTPDFDFSDGRTGYREGMRTTPRGREAFWQKSAATAEKTKLLDVPVNAAIDAGFDAMIRSQWSMLATAGGIRANFLLPSALRFLNVNIKRVQKKPVVGVTHLRMRLDTWYGFAAPDTDLDYRSSDRRLLRFRGIGNIHDARGRNQAVRIEFPGGLEARQASVSEITAARRLPLTGRCGA